MLIGRGGQECHPECPFAKEDYAAVFSVDAALSRRGFGPAADDDGARLYCRVRALIGERPAQLIARQIIGTTLGSEACWRRRSSGRFFFRRLSSTWLRNPQALINGSIVLTPAEAPIRGRL